MADRAGTVKERGPPETVYLMCDSTCGGREGIGEGEDTHAAPEHAVPVDMLPLTTSQYDPAGREVANVDVHAESWLLIATKPSAPLCSRSDSELDRCKYKRVLPLPNASCCEEGETW